MFIIKWDGKGAIIHNHNCTNIDNIYNFETIVNDILLLLIRITAMLSTMNMITRL